MNRKVVAAVNSSPFQKHSLAGRSPVCVQANAFTVTFEAVVRTWEG